MKSLLEVLGIESTFERAKFTRLMKRLDEAELIHLREERSKAIKKVGKT